MGKLVVRGLGGGGSWDGEGILLLNRFLAKKLTDLAVLLVLLQDLFSFTLDGVCYLMQKVGPVLTGEGLQTPRGIPGLDGQLSAAVGYLWRRLWVCITHTHMHPHTCHTHTCTHAQTYTDMRQHARYTGLHNHRFNAEV